MNLDHALKQFDLVEANLAKVETVLKRVRALIPNGVAFMDGSPPDREYRQLSRDFDDLIGALPAIGGWRITATPVPLDSIAQQRMDAEETGELELLVFLERSISEPEHELDEYRARFGRKRLQLIRGRLADLVGEIEGVLGDFDLDGYSPDARSSVGGQAWERLNALVVEVDRLLGGGSRSSSWNDLRRHLSFAKGCDLHDIVKKDWPVVRHEIARFGYQETEPLPVAVQDLDQLIAAKPTGPVATALNWSALDDEAFERLVFCLISDAPGYENPAWLTRTRAADRGRDLSVTRVRHDALAGVSRERVIIQCKHWLVKSIGDTDISDCITKMAHWDLSCEAPTSLDSIAKPPTKGEESAVRELARRLRTGHADAYAALADRVEEELGLKNAKLPPDALGSIDTFRFEERALLRYAGDLISNGKFGEALALVAEREQSFWVDRDVSRKAHWEATRRMAELGNVAVDVRKAVNKTSGDAAVWLEAYVSKDGWFRLDQAQRRLEAWVANLDEEPEERPLGVVRRAHEDVCYAMAEGFTKALVKAVWTVPGALHQTRIWSEVVADKPKPVAYFLVDAMRFEMGVELAERLPKTSEVSVRAALGALPSITPIGMSALMPGASSSFSVVEQGDKLGARIDDSFLPDLASRKKLAASRVPKLVDVALDELLSLQPSKLPEHYVRDYERLLMGGVWAQIDMRFEYDEESKGKHPFWIDKMTPIQIANFDLEEYRRVRREFTTDEWIDLVLRSMGYEPSEMSPRLKLLFLVRLIPLVERNFNLIELGPRGTGKTYVVQEISPYAALLTGSPTVANLFGYATGRQKGLLQLWDVVAFDEVAELKNMPKELVPMLQTYCESGQFQRGQEAATGEASLALFGNTNRPIDVMVQSSHLFEPLPDNLRAMAFLDRLHFYLPGWEVPKMAPNLFTNHYGFVVDYLAEAIRELRKVSYTELAEREFSFGAHLVQRDRKAVQKTFSGLMKIIHPHGEATREETVQLLELALEGRRRVKEQLKKLGSFEYHQTSFSYIVRETGEERFVGVPEQGGRNLIPSDPPGPGTVYTAGVADDSTVGLYRLEVTTSTGTGKLKLAGGVSGAMKESVQRAFAYLGSKKMELGLAHDVDHSDFHVEVIDLLGNRIETEVGVAFFVACCSAIRCTSVSAALLVLGDMSVQGNIKPVRSLMEPLRVAMDNGAKRALIPIENKRSFLDVSADVVEHVDPVFYGDPKTAAMKVMGGA